MVGRALGVALVLTILGGCLGDPNGGSADGDSQRGGLHAICAADAVLPEVGTGICTQVLAPVQEREREASIAAHPTDPNTILVTWRNGEFRDGPTIEAAFTSDGGAHWIFTTLRDPSMEGFPTGGRYNWDSVARFGPDGTGYVLYGDYRYLRAADTVTAFPDFRLALAATRDGVTWTYHSFQDVPAGGAVKVDYMDLGVAPDTGRLVVTALAFMVPPVHVSAPPAPIYPGADGGIWSWTSDDQGATWSDPVVAIPGVPLHTHFLPRVAVGTDGLVLLSTHTWPSYAGDEGSCPTCTAATWGMVTISRDGGNTWGQPQHVFDFTDSAGFHFNAPAAIWKDSTGVHVALVYGEAGAVTGLRSDDQGLTWSPPIRLASPPNGTSHLFLRAEARDDGVWASYRWGSDDPPRFGASMLHWTPAGVHEITVADWPIKGAAPAGFGDDYGAAAVAADGTAWMAFSDGENGGERVRIAHVGS